MITNKEDRLRLKQQAYSVGLHYEYVEDRLSDSVTDADGGQSWDEIDLGQPGDLNQTPCIVHCYNSGQPGAVTRRSYSYIQDVH